MRNISNKFWLGIAVIVIPFLGLPSSWKTFLFVITGIWLCVSAFKDKTGESFSASSKSYVDEGREVKSFSENQPSRYDTY
ncbi:hypothetical protein KGQ31_00635 [Patescibacteria group bacterium]|nr:hypothetical protein [Patescibacteria group bacterium]